MEWDELKARILAGGPARIEGPLLKEYLAVSVAGPGAGGEGSVFFALGNRRVRIPVGDEGDLVLEHRGKDNVVLRLGGELIEGRLEPIALHCPRQAYITVSGGCIYHCRVLPGPRPWGEAEEHRGDQGDGGIGAGQD